jgi:hypothetical protein
MRDHYVGDITDFIKFALLRRLQSPNRLLGISWYYIESCDNSCDGLHIEWTDSSHWKTLDHDLHPWLKDKTKGHRQVERLQDLAFWPNTLFYSTQVAHKRGRTDWATTMYSDLQKANLIFLDPDNGIKEGSRKHASMSEIRQFRQDGRTIVCIVFPHRNTTHDIQLATLEEQLKSQAGAISVVTLRTNVSLPNKNYPGKWVQRPRWFVVIDPNQSDRKRLASFARDLNNLNYTKACLSGE